MPILTTTELKSLRDIGSKIDTSKAEEAIKLAETVDLYNALGNFYFDVVENKDSVVTAWTELFAGSTFTINGNNFIHEGVKALIADYAYARYAQMINSNFTPFGMTVKSTPDSEPVSDERLKQITLNAKRDADAKLRFIDLFLNENKSTFSRYFESEEDCKTDNIVNRGSKWSII
jgi:hypothetical protein